MRRVLAVGAHPDDVEIGCGGTLLRHAEAGDQIRLLTLTNGERGGRAAERIEEARASAALLGADLRILDFPDTMLTSDGPLIAAIEAAIAEYAPTHVYMHSRHDTHQDHRAVFAAARVATRSIANVACYQSPSTTVDFAPALFVDIEQTLSRKLELIAAHVTQWSHRPNIDPELMRATARYWGRFAGGGHVEAFEIVRQTGFS